MIVDDVAARMAAAAVNALLVRCVADGMLEYTIWKCVKERGVTDWTAAAVRTV